MKKSIGAKTILYPTPVLIVGTYDKSGNPNVMTVAWGGICCSSPPCVSISVREATHTYGNLMEQKAFTISIPSEKYVKQADFHWHRVREGSRQIRGHRTYAHEK